MINTHTIILDNTTVKLSLPTSLHDNNLSIKLDLSTTNSSKSFTYPLFVPINTSQKEAELRFEHILSIVRIAEMSPLSHKISSVKIMYDYIFIHCMDDLFHNPRLKKVVIEKAYDYKEFILENMPNLDCVSSINKVLVKLQLPLYRPSVDTIATVATVPATVVTETTAVATTAVTDTTVATVPATDTTADAVKEKSVAPNDDEINRIKLLKSILAKYKISYKDELITHYYQWLKTQTFPSKLNRYQKLEAFVKTVLLSGPFTPNDTISHITLLKSILAKYNLSYRDEIITQYYHWLTSHSPYPYNLNRYQKLEAFVKTLL